MQLDRLNNWLSVKGLDGTPAIDATSYNDPSLWGEIGTANLPYEFLLTNQVIVGAEFGNPSPHVALRGGYSNGMTVTNAKSNLRTTAVWSTFSFTGSDPWVQVLRQGETYSPKEAAKLAGIGATHEIGHQLFHFGHPFGARSCVMNPPPLLAFRAWANHLSPKECSIGMVPEMRAGAVNFYSRD